MSTTGRKDDAGDPGSVGMWKNGFNIDCGLPGPLLVESPSRGPWKIIENTRAPKNRYYVVRVGPQKLEIYDVLGGHGLVAWIGNDMTFACLLVERFNGYELSKDFPMQPHQFESQHRILERKAVQL